MPIQNPMNGKVTVVSYVIAIGDTSNSTADMWGGYVFTKDLLSLAKPREINHVM